MLSLGCSLIRSKPSFCTSQVIGWKIVPEMTYYVLSGPLNPPNCAIPSEHHSWSSEIPYCVDVKPLRVEWITFLVVDFLFIHVSDDVWLTATDGRTVQYPPVVPPRSSPKEVLLISLVHFTCTNMLYHSVSKWARENKRRPKWFFGQFCFIAVFNLSQLGGCNRVSKYLYFVREDG